MISFSNLKSKNTFHYLISDIRRDTIVKWLRFACSQWFFKNLDIFMVPDTGLKHLFTISRAKNESGASSIRNLPPKSVN